MKRCGVWVVVLGALVMLAKPVPARAQCRTFLRNLVSPDMERFGQDSAGNQVWLGQRFTTDCDGKFLTVGFYVYLSPVNYDGVPPLTIGDTVTCSVLDSDDQTIASVDHTLTFGYNYQWVEFDFAPLDLGLAAGQLTAKITTPQAAFGYLAVSGDEVPGNLVVGYDNSITPSEWRDATFTISWNPNTNVVAETVRTWGAVKGLYR